MRRRTGPAAPTGWSARATTFVPASTAPIASWRRGSPSASSRAMARCHPSGLPRRSMSAFAAIAEQHEAKRLLSAALAEGPAHAYLLYGPPGVGKRDLALLFAAD